MNRQSFVSNTEGQNCVADMTILDKILMDSSESRTAGSNARNPFQRAQTTNETNSSDFGRDSEASIPKTPSDIQITPQISATHNPFNFGREPAPKNIFENARLSLDNMTPNSANKKLMEMLPQLNKLTKIVI